jgi:uncharacterized protein YkwD
VWVKCPSLRQLGCLLILSSGLLACASWADPVAAVQLLRVSGCGGILPAYQPLQQNRQLDRAAAVWAAGGSPGAAAARSGYQAQVAVGLRLSGPDDSILQSLRGTRCRQVDDLGLRDVGVYRQATQTWMVIAAPAAEPAPSQIQSPEPQDNEPAPHAFAYATAPSPAHTSVAARTPVSAQRVLQLVNEVRASGSRCGEKSFGPAAPLQGSGTLNGVAADHAGDMARHDYFEHVDLKGNTPADRVRATGYREKLVGENIAYGPTSAEEVVSGWLHSTGHCENIMDPRFVQMGLATAPGQGSRRGLYWDQVLAEPAQ